MEKNPDIDVDVEEGEGADADAGDMGTREEEKGVASYKLEDNDLKKDLDKDTVLLPPPHWTRSHLLYRMNKENYIHMALHDHGKHGFLTKLKHGNTVDLKRLNELCSVVTRHGHKSDFNVIILIRFLYLQLQDSSPHLNPHREQVEKALADFSFWTGDTEIDSRRMAMEKTIFWSENHTFMYLSSAYLFHQHLIDSSSPLLATSCVNYADRDRLLIYLESHCHPKFNGVYEVLSCTYLPWTICALLNLFDFAKEPKIRDLSRLLLDNIITTFCLVSTRDGICNLTASTRQYLDLRTKTWGHNINQLMFLITGKTTDPLCPKPSPLGDFLATSFSYLPPEDILERYFEFHGSIEKKKMNHLTKETREVYREARGERSVEILELTPFYWSAGLITHPKYVNETLDYIEKYNLSKNPGISALTYLPGKVAKRTMDTFDTLSKGQAYTSISLNLFKSPSRSVVMTSFDRYNVGRHAYQQNTWMANLNGVGLWSQSGVFLDLERLNISNPAVTQRDNILLAVYYMHHTVLLDNAINLFWPRPYFSAESRQNAPGGPFLATPPPPSIADSSLLSKTQGAMTNVLRMLSGGGGAGGESGSGVGTAAGTWWVGCRENMFVGIFCNKPTEEDRSLRNDSQIQFFRGDPVINIPRRKCNYRKVFWLVVVGDTMMYPTLSDFQSYLTQIRTEESLDEHQGYTVRVCSRSSVSSSLVVEGKGGHHDDHEEAKEGAQQLGGSEVEKDPLRTRVSCDEEIEITVSVPAP